MTRRDERSRSLIDKGTRKPRWKRCVRTVRVEDSHIDGERSRCSNVSVVVVKETNAMRILTAGIYEVSGRQTDLRRVVDII